MLKGKGDRSRKKRGNVRKETKRTAKSFPGGSATGVSSSSQNQNKKKMKKKKKQSGGFHAWDLTRAVFSGVMRQGYRFPTPIQRRAVPPALAGRDVVAMARTGSGKTAAFVIPMLERLHAIDLEAAAGANLNISSGDDAAAAAAIAAAAGSLGSPRALILSPTRELAVQTFRFIRSLGKFTGLSSALLVGGESLRAQFAALDANPAIVVATPGRLAHLLDEVQGLRRRLGAVSYVVFDEADRLFEMGFKPTLLAILQHCNPGRQTLLFSATLPTALAQFASAGLREPVIVRLDAETKVSENLRLVFLRLRSEERMAALLMLLRELIPNEQQAMVFVATRQYAELVANVLNASASGGVDGGAGGGDKSNGKGLQSYESLAKCVYGSMHQESRNKAMAEFRKKKVRVLVATDVASRGIDIPLLDNTINFHFPGKPKLFVHRVGRVARQGRQGTAFSFVSADELPYAIDLHLFLARRVVSSSTLYSPESSKDSKKIKKKRNRSAQMINGRDINASDSECSSGKSESAYGLAAMTPDHVHVGWMPQATLDDDDHLVRRTIEASSELQTLARSAKRSMQKYEKTRGAASRSSVKRAKEFREIDDQAQCLHPLLEDLVRRRRMMTVQRSGSANGGDSGDIGRSSLVSDSSASGLHAFRAALRGLRPKQTVLELELSKAGKGQSDVMRRKRREHAHVVPAARGLGGRANNMEEDEEEDKDDGDDDGDDDDQHPCNGF